MRLYISSMYFTNQSGTLGEAVMMGVIFPGLFPIIR
jgi:hypothetical protein